MYVSGTAGKLTVDVPTTGFVQQVARIQDTNVSVSGNSGTAVLQVNIGTPIAADAYDDDDQGVTSIATSAPITGGTITSTGTIGISAATTSAAGSMSAADKTKLDGIETSADVTDETNVKAAIDGMTLSDIGTPASSDRILIQEPTILTTSSSSLISASSEEAEEQSTLCPTSLQAESLDERPQEAVIQRN